MIAGAPMFVSIASAFVAAAVAPLAYRRWPRATSVAAVAVAGVLFAAFVAQVTVIASGEVIAHSIPWIPSLDVIALFRLDGLSLLFALIITGIGALVLAYCPGYLGWGRRTGHLIGLLLAFLGSMLGLVLADDAITMFVFWELTSFSSFFLIAFDRSAEALAKARQALVVTSAGGLALLVGLLLLATAVPGGGVSVALSSVSAFELRDHPDYATIVVLIAIGAFTKSAQVPFHFWLPGAMVAPTPVSAYLHAATMVKAGIYVLARLNPTLGDTMLWTGLLGAVGSITFVVGGLLAVVQRDLKLTLAYATISVLGALTLLLGLGGEAAIEAAIVFLVAHAAYKATLFLVAGNLDHQRGTRDPFARAGAARQMPATAAAALLAAASMAGIPVLVGFIAKDAVLVATLQGAWPALVTTSAVIAAAALVTAAWLASYAPFLRTPRLPWRWQDAPPGMLAGPIALAVLGVAFGIAPGVLLEPIARPAASAIAGAPLAIELERWSGLGGIHGAAFGLGMASLAIGSLGYAAVARHRRGIARLVDRLDRADASRAYEAVISGLQVGAEWLTRTVQHGRLPGYITAVIVTTVVAAGLPLIWFDASGLWPRNVRLGGYEVLLVLVAAAGAVAAATLRDRLASVAALSATGLAISFLFALFSGPDLAITQLTVETMMVILLVLVFRRMPPSAMRARAKLRLPRVLVAGSAGALASLLLVLATSVETFEPDASHAYVELAPGEHSENVVNAILVDFRAIDTLGEITVLAIAGIGVLSLLGVWTRQGRRVA